MSKVQMNCEIHAIRGEDRQFHGEQWVTISGQCDPNNAPVINPLFTELVRALPPHLVVQSEKEHLRSSFSLKFRLKTDTVEQCRQTNAAKETLRTVLGSNGYTVNGIPPNILIFTSSRA